MTIVEAIRKANDMRLTDTSAFSTIELSESKEVPKRVQVLRVGKFKHPRYGDFEITPKTLAEMKKNFDARVRGVDIAFDYYHESEKDASGWPKKLSLTDDGKELWAEDVEWTPAAQKKLADKELRYFSPDFSSKWTNPENGTVHHNVLFGGGLTNRPFVKEMQPIVLDEKERSQMKTELEKAQEEIVGLKDQLKAAQGENIKLAEGSTTVKSEIEALKKQVATLSDDNKKLSEANAKAKEDEAKAAKEAEFTKLLSEKKACPAQKEAFLAGDMAKFISLAEPANFSGKGSSTSTTTKEDKDQSDLDAKVLKLAEEKEKAGKPYREAIREARAELKVIQ